MKTADVIVCGGGVIGCAIARELSADGVSVTVLERGQPGGEASGAAAGLITGQADFDEDTAFARLCRESAALYPGFVEAVSRESGIDVSFSACGSLRVAASPSDEGAMAELERWQRAAGWPVERISGGRLTEAGGGDLSPGVREALFFPEEAVVDTGALVEALRVSAERSGARFVTARPVLSIAVEDGECRGVRTAEGDLAAGAVIDAAGSWAAFDSSLPFSIPIRPMRGQIVELAADEGPPARVIHGGGFYVAPRERGRILVGATVEDAGFEKKVTAGAVSDVIGRGLALVPRLSGARFVSAWAGLRPAAPDGLPILGVTPLPGFFLAAGHFRNGILLAPITARILADDVLGRGAPGQIAPYSIARFERNDGAGHFLDSALHSETRLGNMDKR